MKYSELIKNIIHVHLIKQVHQYVSWNKTQFLEYNTIVKLKKKALISSHCQFYNSSSETF